MTDRLAIAAVQANPTVGAIEANEARARGLLGEACAQGAELALFSELFVTGYPPEDLAMKPAFVRDSRAAVERLAAATRSGCAAVIGAIWPGEEKPRNAAVFMEGGEIRDVTFKSDLPNYNVFDEKRVFEPGPTSAFRRKGVAIGVPVCEDIWTPAVCRELKAQGAEMLLVPNGSPFRETSDDERIGVVRARVAETGLPLLYVNQVCGQDELVFDGASFAVQGDGSCAMRLPLCEEALAVTRWERGEGGWRIAEAPMVDWPERLETLYRVMVLGLRDYVDKSRFPGVLLGLSGGIDSALVATIAVDAFGAERVRCVMLPSPYTSRESLEDAQACAQALGVRYDTIPIAPGMEAFSEMLAEAFKDAETDVTEENIQSRLRGVTLMALSNKTGWMLLTTGNKSEMAVGYATLYGDMSGGFNPLKDLYKTDVYAVSHWRNANDPWSRARAPIPERILTKAPSAELKPGQTDQDSLPPYEVLDGILRGLVEEEATLDQIVARGFDPATVERVQRMLYATEYKRRQAPPGVKLGARAFGRDRRYPLVNGYRDRVGR
ncbi:MAG TPA: NAD+ synthase [Caulobacteraceae bacterium]|jgi:NAD+ synthase